MSDPLPDKQRHTTYFTGSVQGVGFRFTTELIAGSYHVTGFVRNLPDGRVELVAEGHPDELERFLAKITNTMQPNIDDIQTNHATATGEFTSFFISR